MQSSDHRDDVFLARLAGRNAAHDSTASHHPDPGGQAHYLFEIVADDDNADAAGHEVSDEGLDLSCLPDTERSRRLIHDDELAAPHDTAGDGDRLTPAA